MLVVRGNELALHLDDVVAARCAVVAVGEGRIEGDAAAALLFSDWAVMHPRAELVIDSPAALAAAVWRIGGRAVRCGARAASPADALRRGLCDAIGDGEGFLAGRSEVALDAAAGLIRGRGGDALERATFAWLFAAGEPAAGLGAFLEKRLPRFGPE